MNLARVLAMQGKSPEGEKILSDLLAKQPTSEPALSMLTSTYVQSGRLPQAVALMEKAYAADSANVRITVALGDLYIRSGTPQKAIDLLGKDKSASAANTDLLSMKAAAQLALGQKKEAQATYTDLLKIDPNVIGARRQLAALLIEAGDFETARNVLQAGITAAPRNYQLYQDYVLTDLKATGVDAALATADRLISQDREFGLLKGLKGDVYLAANRPADAVNSFKEAMKQAPSSTMVTRLAGAMLRAGKPNDALQTLNDWVKNNPKDVVALEQLGEINIALNRLDDAAKALEALLQAKPYEAIALNNLAWVYQQQKNPKAQELARQAYVLAPGPQTADTLGWILTTSGKADAGVSLLRQAAGEATNDPRILYHYAVALKDTGNKDDAIKQLKSVIAAKGEFTEKKEAQKLLDEMTKGS